MYNYGDVYIYMVISLGVCSLLRRSQTMARRNRRASLKTQ